MVCYRETALKYLSELRPAPSVGLQDVPRESLGEHLGFSSTEQPVDELDERVARACSALANLRSILMIFDIP